MKSKKYFKVMFLLSALALTACNGDYIKCSTIKIGTSVAFDYAPETTYLIAKYKSSESIPGTASSLEGEDYVFYVYVIVRENEKEPTFPQTATYTDQYYSETPTDYNLTLIYQIGKYTSYANIYYSKSKKEVKYERVYYKPVKADHDAEIQTKMAMRVLTDNGQVNMQGLRVSTGEYIRTQTETKIVDTGNEVVTYTPLK